MLTCPVNTILVIGSERLYSSIMKNYDNKPTSSASAAASDERVSVIKLSKSGGCVDRDAAFMKGIRESQIRSYFFGNPIPSTASAALSLSSASSTTNITLSPHAQQLDFNAMAVYNVNTVSTDEDEDEYDPSQLDSFLPGGASDETTTTAAAQEDDNNTPSSKILAGIHNTNNTTNITTSATDNINDTNTFTTPLKKLPPPPPTTLANSLLAITHAPTHASPAEIRDASIMGFLYVADVDAEKRRVRVLAPMRGRVPPRAVVWGRKWPGEVVGLVG